MGFLNKSGIRAMLALSLTMFCAACATSNRNLPEAERPRFPDLPREMEVGCPPLPINPDALVSLVQHRQALAECRRLQRRTADFYNTATGNAENLN